MSFPNLASFFFPSKQQREFDRFDSLLQDPCAKPLALTLDFLKHITSDFSKEKVLGSGGFGDVYKGILKNGKTVAVKRLKIRETNLGDDEYKKEVTNLFGLENKNIVQLRGYCADTSQVLWSQGREKSVLVERRERLLCFEYAPNKSLREHISDISCGLEWRERYEIIRGICSGLHYLHMERGIVHMDLKPENILLDDNMVPKIADFGMSRLFGENQTRINTKSCVGTLGYMAKEYMNHGLISKKADIFSFGVIILELVTGSKGDYPHSKEYVAQFTKDVVAKWRNRLPNAGYIEQVDTCISIGLNCVDDNRDRRPTTGYIIEKINEVKNPSSSSWSRVMTRIREQALSPDSRILGLRLWPNRQEVTILTVAIGALAVVLALQNPSSAWSWVVTTLKVLTAAVILFASGAVAVALALYLYFYLKDPRRVRSWKVPVGGLAVVLVLLNPSSAWSWVVTILKFVIAVGYFFVGAVVLVLVTLFVIYMSCG